MGDCSKEEEAWQRVCEFEKKKTNVEKLTLQLDDGRLLGHLADVLPLQARTAHRGHGHFARLDRTNTPPLRTLHDEKHAYEKKVGSHSQSQPREAHNWQ